MAHGLACNAILGIDDVTGPGSNSDASIDAPDGPPAAPRPRSPLLGASTGSVHAPASLRPAFTWRPSLGATRYELVVDDSCTVATFRSCIFPSPEVTVTDLAAPQLQLATPLPVAMSQPVGRRYYWRVRGCDATACGPWSDIWYVNVGQLADDVNGDGYGDLIVGTDPDAGVPEIGKAYVVFGRGGGGAPTLTALPDPAARVGTGFGQAVAMVGDLNADGYGDVAVGAWQASRAVRTGWVSVYLGRGSWPATVATESSGFAIAESEPSNNLGAVLAGRGDVNGDGYGDFATSALALVDPPTLAGRVYVLLGRALLPELQLGADLVIPDPRGMATNSFGRGLHLGDLNGDGLADVVVGAPRVDADRGASSTYFGRRDFPPSPAQLTNADVDVQSPATGMALFGLTATLCQAPNGLPLLAIGAPYEDAPGTWAGKIRLYGGRDPWPSSVRDADRTISDPAGTVRDRMGFALACADVVVDGRADLIAAAPNDDLGVIYVFSDVHGLPAVFTTVLSAGSDGETGYRIATTDFNGDGAVDVFAAIPNRAAGAVVGWFGRTTWPAAVTSPDLTIANPSAIIGETFGKGLD